MPPRPPYMGLPQQSGARAEHDPSGRGPVSGRLLAAEDCRTCTRWWRGDDGLLHLCDLGRGHFGDCACVPACGSTYSETGSER
jgi:hypothetical protein